MDNIKTFEEFHEIEKNKVNEDYIELMPELDTALQLIKADWERWKNGPMTEPSDVKPAKKELLDYISSELKKNIK